MNLSEAISKEHIKSIVKGKILNNSRILDISSPNKASISTTITPIYKAAVERVTPTENTFTSVSKEFNKDSTIIKDSFRLSSKEAAESLKSRVEQSYKSLSVETNNKVKKWKKECVEEDQFKTKEKEKLEFFLKKISKKSEPAIPKFDSLTHPTFKTDKFINPFNSGIERTERKPRYAASDNLKYHPSSTTINNKQLKKLDSKEYADKIIVNLHNRMDSFTKTYDNISNKLNKMITKVAETDQEKELTLSNYNNKFKRMNTRYEQEIVENE